MSRKPTKKKSIFFAGIFLFCLFLFLPQKAFALDQELLFSMVNSKRAEVGLASFEKHPEVCSVAQSRGPQLLPELQGGYLHAGFWNRNLPYWATENMIWFDSETSAVNWWLNSYVHRSAIYGSYKYSCLVCSGNACVQIFTNLTPKYTYQATPVGTTSSPVSF